LDFAATRTEQRTPRGHASFSSRIAAAAATYARMGALAATTSTNSGDLREHLGVTIDAVESEIRSLLRSSHREYLHKEPADRVN
jgi:hypothetical protein